VGVGTVIVLTSADGRHATLLDEFLLRHPAARVVIIDDTRAGSRSARTCIAISQLAPAAPLTIVSIGDAAPLLPQVAVAQRAAHRRVGDYLLVDPELPLVSESWPDAPVTVMCDATTEASLVGRLRGWTVLSLDALLDWTPSSD
jgi:hypothetical protein